jgi:hypothetical protein
MQELHNKRELCRDLMGGTDAMIAAGKRWIPQFEKESALAYKNRVEGTVLTNFLEQTIIKQTGKIFSKTIVLNDNVPEDIVAICENIDRQGRRIDSFLLDVTKGAFCDGIGYILVDVPPSDGIRTKAEEKIAGIRPYAIKIDACDILEVVSEMIGGVETLTRLRVKEESCRPIPGTWDYQEIERVRVYELVDYTNEAGQVDKRVTYTVYQEDDKENWIQVEKGLTSFRRIPLIPVYTNRVGYMEGSPPNQSIAELNLRHWRSSSEQNSALSFARFPIVTATGIDAESQIVIAPNKLLQSSNPDARFAIMEHTGKGIEAGANDLKSIEAAIETASATLRIERAGSVTATAAAIDSAENNAGLKAVAAGIGDSIEEMFGIFASILGMEGDVGGEVKVNDDFGEAKGTPGGLQELGKLRAIGDLSRNQTFNIMKWRGELPSDFDSDINEEELSAEGDRLGTIPATDTKPKKTTTITKDASGNILLTEG